MSMQVAPNDPRLTWEGAISFEHGDGWIKPWRIPFEQRMLYGQTQVDDMMLSRAGMPAGGRIVFNSDTQFVEGEIEPVTPNEFNVPETDEAKLDLVCDGAVHETIRLGKSTSFRFDGLPEGRKLLELWLPEYREMRIRGLSLSDGASVEPYQDTRPMWLVYGSSNSQSRGAQSPFYTWPAVAARAADLSHMNLSYGGQCHLDSMVARLLRDIPAAIIGLEIGINIYINATLNARSLRAAMIGFLQILREGHPNTPIAVMSSVYSWERETTVNAAGLSLQGLRDVVEESVEACRATGDRNTHYFDGLKLIGEAEKDIVEDHLHPNAEGYKLLGERFANTALMPLMKGSAAASPTR